MDAQLGEQRVDRANLQARATASVAQFGSINVVLPVWRQEWQSGKSFYDILAGTGSGESLQQFLKDQPGGNNRLAALQGMPQGNDFGG